MKTLKIILFGLILIIGTLSCKDPLQKSVSKETIGEIMSLVEKGEINLEKDAIRAFKNIEEMAMERSDYIDHLRNENNDKTTEAVIKKLLEEKEYKKETSAFFDFLKEKKISYQKNLDEIKRLDQLFEQSKSEINNEATEIDKICVEIQDAINNYEAFKKSIDNKLTLKVLGLKKTTYKGKKAIAIEIRVANAFKQPVHTVTFRVEVKDFEGNSITMFSTNIDEKITPSYTTTLIYDQKNIVDPLYGKEVYHFMFEGFVFEVNIDGVIYFPSLESYGKIDLPHQADFIMDFEYESQYDPNGYCPYLNSNKTLYHNNIKKIKEGIQKQIEEEGYFFKKINDETNVFK